MNTQRLLAVVTFALATFAYADSQKLILGIRLGQDLQGQFSPCEGRRDNWCTLSSLPPGMLMPPDSDSPTGLPTWVKRDRLFLEPNKEGKVDRFYVTTLGPQVQDRVADSVSARFGPATQQERLVKQTAQGARVEVLNATWKTGEAVIEHRCGQILAKPPSMRICVPPASIRNASPFFAGYILVLSMRVGEQTLSIRQM